MEELKIFKNAEFGQVRTVTIDGEPWFVGKDIAEALGYSNTKDAIKTHIDDEDKIMGSQNATPYITDNMGRKQFPTFINESGLYSLILSSKLPTAKKFKRWVTSEVLPAIRKKGSYTVNQKNLNTEETLANALLMAQSIIASKDKQIAEMQIFIQNNRNQLKDMPAVPQIPEIYKQNNQPQVCVKEQVIGVLARILAKELDCSQNEVIGLVVRFWMWTMKNLDKNQNIQMVDREDIEEALLQGHNDSYNGGEAVDALISVGLIEGMDLLEAADWTYWQDIVMKDTKRKAADRTRQRAYRERQKLVD